MQLRHTLGPGVDDQFHVAVVRDKLTRNLATLYPDVLDEITQAFGEYIPANDHGASPSGCRSVRDRDADGARIVPEWVPVTIFPIVQKIIARASNRVIIGLPRCELL